MQLFNDDIKRNPRGKMVSRNLIELDSIYALFCKTIKENMVELNVASWCSLRREHRARRVSLYTCVHMRAVVSPTFCCQNTYCSFFLSSRYTHIPENWGLFRLTILHFRCVLLKKVKLWESREALSRGYVLLFALAARIHSFFAVNALREKEMIAFKVKLFFQ